MLQTTAVKSAAVGCGRTAIAAGLILLAGCALQRDVNSQYNHIVALSQRNDKLEQRIAVLDREIVELKRRQSVSEQRSGSLQDKTAENVAGLVNAQKAQTETDQQLREQLAGLRSAVNDMRQEVQALNGQVEVSDHLLKQKAGSAEELEKKLDSRLAFLEENSARYQDRIDKLEQYLSLDSAHKKTVNQPTGGGTEKELSEQKLYARAKQSFDKGELDAARKGFETLLEKYPKSNNADNAQFWIGEIYYREKWYEKAILEYQKVIDNYPKGNKLTAALLKQGFAFINIGDATNARLIFRELISKYPDTNEAKVAAKKMNELK